MRHSPDQRYSSGILALLVHIIFFGFLFFGFSWQEELVGPNYVELWQSFPEIDTIAEPKLEPKPEPKLEPKPEPKLEPKPEPKPEPKSQLKPKIESTRGKSPSLPENSSREALIQLKEKRLKLKQERESLIQRTKSRQEKYEERMEKQRQLVLEREEQRKIAENLQRKAELDAVEKSRALEATMRREKAILEERFKKAKRSAELSLVEKYKALIAEKVKLNIVLPPSLEGNLEVIYDVKLTIQGKIVDLPVLVESSGVILYDEAVDKAIRKSDPLPVPSEIEVFNDYFRNFRIRFRPEE